ncbi:MAG: UMP kinase [Planctomycetes bacterium]|nr:UMP kinase [Planctomycetota bacterium]
MRRIVLKVSGESFSRPGVSGIDADRVAYNARQIRMAHEMGREVAVVVGGGNLVRGSDFQKQGMGRATADQMGMLATVINGLALQDELERRHNVETRLMSAIHIGEVAEPYIRRRALRHLEKGRIVILAAGTGSPYFTTDTTAALRANEIRAGLLLKATKVDGVYDDDPARNPNAALYHRITYLDVINNRFRVMDSTAITLCMEYSLPILVFNLLEDGSVRRVLLGEDVGTLITDRFETRLRE